MEKVFRDPVHDFIVVDDSLILELIDTPEFQRLRRIHQLGAAYGTYHGAEHSRFSHSLGAMHVMRKVIRRFCELGFPISESEQRLAALAALLHDIGHGPFSHLWEKACSGESHESWAWRIITGDTKINDVLRSQDPSLPAKVVQVLRGEYSELSFLGELISSQLDVDRMDYLLRDALYCGVSYGRFDLERLIHTMSLSSGRVVVNIKGLANVEEYLLARYFMYWRVYYHKAIRAQEIVFQKVIQRARWLLAHGGRNRLWADEGLLRALDGTLDLSDYIFLDDNEIICVIKRWSSSHDRILADLSLRFLNRRLLKPVFHEPPKEVDPVIDDYAREVLLQRGYDPEYYLVRDRTREITYDYYAIPFNRDGVDHRCPAPIMIEFPGEGLREVSETSPLIRSIAREPKTGINLYVPEDCRDQIRTLVATS